MFSVSNVIVHYEDVLSQTKQSINNEWKNKYKEISTRKGKTYAKRVTEPPRTPWFKGLHLSRTHVTVINRMKCEHTLTRSHLFKINVVDSNLWECGEEKNLSHCLLICLTLLLFANSNSSFSKIIK